MISRFLLGMFTGVLLSVITSCTSFVIAERPEFRVTRAVGQVEIEKKEWSNKPLAPNIEYNKKDITNGCYINAIGFKEAFAAYSQVNGYKPKLSRLVHLDIVTTTKRLEGHAIYVFEYDNVYQIYDVNHGRYMIGEWATPPTLEQIAPKLLVDKNQEITAVDWLK